MRAALLSWFDRAARDLPWREVPRDPYRTLVAEAMLQQTQVVRVAPAYRAFLARFPTLADLAAADLGEVLHAWQGLGYYRRARSLHAAARHVVEHAGGALPPDEPGLALLPGVGRYTAAAVAAQAFGAPVVAVDANVRRVGRRVLGRTAASDDDVAAHLTHLLLHPEAPAPGRRGEVAEALIELGALLCRPTTPACGSCPLAAACAAAASTDARGSPPPGTPVRRPPPRREHLRVLVALRGGDVALVQRAEDGRWGGLWSFPSPASEAAASLPALATVRHRTTHRSLEVTPHLGPPEAAPDGAVWVPLADVAAGRAAVAVSMLERRVAAAVVAHADAP